MNTIHTPASRGEALNEPTARLLVVDDDPLNLDMLSRRLRRTGFSVHVASSGRQALEIIGEISFDLVLLDQMMPEMNGAEVLQILRSKPATQMLPVIMVTAVADSESIGEALDNGANDYITKPVNYRVALARIQSQLARRRTELALRQSEERYALVAQASREGLWDWNLATGVVYFSPRWQEMLGLEPPVENTAETWFSRIVPADRKAIADAIEEYLRGTKEVLQCTYRMRHMDGSARWMSCRAITTRNENGVAIRIAGSQSDITEEKTRDPLTGLPNKLALISQLECADAQEGYAVLLLDLIDFKAINDSLGHLAGDKLLVSIAARLDLTSAKWTSGGDNSRPPLLTRTGGDEFAILLQGAALERTLGAFAEELQEAMKEPFDLEGLPVHCSFSMGAALANELNRQPEDILREAGIAMYIAKAGKSGKIVLFDPSMREIATQQLELEDGIRFAAARGELVLTYQPKVALSTGLTYGVEALVRWNHPNRGLLEPSVFIPIAERTGAIVEMGAWILRTACTQVRAWQNEFPESPSLELSVNLSPREFKQPQLVEVVARTLQETGFPPALLHFELTEGALVDDIAAARETLHALKQLGVGLDLDDFGSGYSSFKYLRELPFDTLKIDRYFIESLDPNQSSSEELVRAIVDMADVLGLAVIAEGVETESHRATLRVLGCRFGQGYLFGKPLNSEALHDLLALERSPHFPGYSKDPSPPLMAMLPRQGRD